MNPMLTICRFYIPPRFRIAKLRELFALTVSAFEKDMPDIGGKSFDDCLRAYAVFTSSAVHDAYLESRDIREIEDRLYQSGKVFGSDFRKRLFIRGENQADRAIEILYAAIGIDLKCLTNGQVIVSRCFFSDFYDSPTCAVVSALDNGLVAGLTNGASLVFAKRITDGNKTCVASLSYGEKCG